MTDTQTSEAPRATFTRMDQSTKADWDIIVGAVIEHAHTKVAGQVISQLEALRGDHGGFAVDRLTHCLQTAHLAEQAGKDDEYIVCALLHDVGDVLAPFNHPDIAAGILKPYVSEANHWMVQNHGTVQGYYYFHHLGLDRDARDALKGHEFYDHCEEFCAKFDMPAFDPEATAPPLSYYVPLLDAMFGPGGLASREDVAQAVQK